jgi:hypothetical protein
MSEDSDDSRPVSIWLTRSEAARYVGVSGESAIRAAEAKGLEAESDADGQFWHTPKTLNAWTWRGKPPSATQKARVVREAVKARRQEARERERKDEAALEQEQAEWAAQLSRSDAEDALRTHVRQKAREQRVTFEAAHLNERTAGRALGFKSWEACGRLRDLVNRGLLRRVESPPEPRVDASFDGAREVASHWPLCSGGPFFVREEVLALRRDVTVFAKAELSHAPAQVLDVARATTTEVIIAQLLRALLENLR